jgi:hypothetical protein
MSTRSGIDHANMEPEYSFQLFETEPTNTTATIRL